MITIQKKTEEDCDYGLWESTKKGITRIVRNFRNSHTMWVLWWKIANGKSFSIFSFYFFSTLHILILLFNKTFINHLISIQFWASSLVYHLNQFESHQLAPFAFTSWRRRRNEKEISQHINSNKNNNAKLNYRHFSRFAEFHIGKSAQLNGLGIFPHNWINIKHDCKGERICAIKKVALRHYFFAFSHTAQ